VQVNPLFNQQFGNTVTIEPMISSAMPQ